MLGERRNDMHVFVKKIDYVKTRETVFTQPIYTICVLELIISVNNFVGEKSSCCYLHLAKLAISSRTGVTAAN